MKSNIIFLDIDGVLNGYNIFTELLNKVFRICRFKSWKFVNKVYQSQFCIDDRRMKLLSKLAEETNSEIVLTSSMRYAFWLTPYSLKTGICKKASDAFKEYKITVIGITKGSEEGNRGDEIQEWIDSHQGQFNNYVIFDDENTLLPQFINNPNFIQTSSVPPGQMIKGHWSENTGLRRKHIKQARSILMKR